MAPPRIVVINPNSNAEVTAGLDRALAPLRLGGGPEIVCETLAAGPRGIESEADVANVAPLVRARVEAGGAAAWVIACYSDPGLQACREATRRPVFGIGESGLMTALQRGERVGVVAILQRSIARHWRYARTLGVTARITGERPLELTVAELADEGRTWRRLVEVAADLRRRDQADTIVLGCAGMARYRRLLEVELGLPVVDPTLAAVTMALGAVVSEEDGDG